jgi:hypothetical protein
MSEERYRICKLVVMVVFVFGALGIGGKIADSVREFAENGRYIQYDYQKDAVTTGNSTQHFPTSTIDTRTGVVTPPVVYNR